MQDLGYGLPKMPLPRTPVKRGLEKGRGFGTPALSIQDPLCMLTDANFLEAQEH